MGGFWRVREKKGRGGGGRGGGGGGSHAGAEPHDREKPQVAKGLKAGE